MLIAATGVLITGGLLLTRWLANIVGSGGWSLLLGGYLAFLIVWAGATANVVLAYRVFGPVSPRPSRYGSPPRRRARGSPDQRWAS